MGVKGGEDRCREPVKAWPWSPSLLLEPLTQGAQAPHHTGTAAFEAGARHDASRTSFQAASSEGLAPPTGEGDDEPQRRSWLPGPPAGPSREGWGVLGRSSLSPSSHLGDKGEILRRRWDGKARENPDPGSAHIFIEFNKTQGRYRDGSRRPGVPLGQSSSQGGSVGPGGGLCQLQGSLPPAPPSAWESREQSLRPLLPLGGSLVPLASTVWRMCLWAECRGAGHRVGTAEEDWRRCRILNPASPTSAQPDRRGQLGGIARRSR